MKAGRLLSIDEKVASRCQHKLERGGGGGGGGGC